jgi:hypothetical protein
MTDGQSRRLAEEVIEMAVEARTERAGSTPHPVIERVSRISGESRRPLLRLVPGPEALLHPKAAEALVLAFRPLSRPR